jgi:DNA repair exonuclease SbcCD ATPase subunit
MMSTVPQRETGQSSPHDGSGANHTEHGSTHDLLMDDDALRKQLETLARDHEQLLMALGLKSGPGSNAAPTTDQATLEEENRLLRERVAELEKQFSDNKPGGQDWSEQQKEYEALVEEKSEVIRALHQKIQELQAAGASATAEGTSAELPVPGDLEQLRTQLEAERDQLRQDEESLMQQMTQMEMTMSRERAEMARQRNELQRLHSEIRHELEVASRDASLRDRLATFQRRHQEFTGRKGTGSASEATAPPTTLETPPAGETPTPKKTNGILRRLFG